MLGFKRIIHYEFIFVFLALTNTFVGATGRVKEDYTSYTEFLCFFSIAHMTVLLQSELCRANFQNLLIQKFQMKNYANSRKNWIAFFDKETRKK